MPRPIRFLAAAVVYGAFAMLLGAFSDAPRYRHLAADAALVRLSFDHAAARREPCRQRTPEEIAALAANMRTATECSRERVDLRVELDLDGETLLAMDVPPTGLARDGEATVYERFPVPAGVHSLTVRMRDSVGDSGFDHVASRDVEFVAGQNFVIDFDAAAGGFVFR